MSRSGTFEVLRVLNMFDISNVNLTKNKIELMLSIGEIMVTNLENKGFKRIRKVLIFSLIIFLLFIISVYIFTLIKSLDRFVSENGSKLKALFQKS